MSNSRKTVGSRTYILVSIFYECVATRLAFERAGFVEQEVHFRDGSVFREHLNKRVPGNRCEQAVDEDKTDLTDSSTVGCKFPT